MTLGDDRRNPFLVAARGFAPKPPPQAVPYWLDPVGWCHDCVRWPRGQALVDYQEQGMRDLVEHHRECIRSPHGAGKSTTASLVVLWFATTRDRAEVDWKIVTTASVKAQLEDYLWPEIHKWGRLLDWAKLGRAPFDEARELLKLHLHLGYGSALAAAVGDPSAIEGAHAEHLLYVFDEAKAIQTEIFDAAEGAFSTAGEGGTEAFALAISTPGEPVGRFYEICARKPGTENWHPTHVTKDMALSAGRITQSWADDSAALWGTESPIYKNRVEGEFAAGGTDGVIPLSWLEKANERWEVLFPAAVRHGRDPRLGTPSVLGDDDPVDRLGVDVAAGGGDLSTIALRIGNVVAEVLAYPFTDDVMDLAEIVTAQQDAHQLDEPTATGQRWPKAIIDAIGIGVGVYHRVRKLRRPCEGFVASEGTKLKDISGEFGFLNKRSLAWWNLREMLDPSTGLDVALPPDDRVTGDLVAPKWREITGGRIQVEAKDDIRKRIGRSTDFGDAIVMVMLDRNAGSGFAEYMRAQAAKREQEETGMADEGRPLTKGELAIAKAQAQAAKRQARPTRVPRHEHLYVRQPDGAIRCNVCQQAPPWQPPAA